MRPGQLEGVLDPAIAEVAHAGIVERVGPCRGIVAAEQRGLLAHRARPVAGAATVGHATIERHADEGDVRVRRAIGDGRAEEGGDAGVAGPHLRVRHLLVSLGLLEPGGLVHAAG